jgi:hypothetical protein
VLFPIEGSFGDNRCGAAVSAAQTQARGLHHNGHALRALRRRATERTSRLALLIGTGAPEGGTEEFSETEVPSSTRRTSNFIRVQRGWRLFSLSLLLNAQPDTYAMPVTVVS